MRIYCPVWFHCTLGASGLSQEDLREYGPDVNSLALAIARLRKTKASAVHYKISAIMFHSGVKHDDLICLGVCMSPDATVYIYMFWHSATSLWLVADFASVASYTTSLFGNIEPSRPRFCKVTIQQGQTTTPGTPCPTLCKQCVGSFTSRRIYEQWRTGRRGLRFYRPCPRRLESLTMCRCNYKGSTFYSVI